MFSHNLQIIMIMAESHGNNTGKKLIQVDISSDRFSPWCFIGKRNLDKAMDSPKDKFYFEVRWHPFFLHPSVPKEGVNKIEFYQKNVGRESEQILARMTEAFRGLGLEYDTSGLTGNTLESHRLITFAGHQGVDKQHALVEELFLGYFTLGKYIGDWEFLVGAASKDGVEGAAEFLEDLNNGVNEVNEELGKYSTQISGVPYYVINGKLKLSGSQQPEVFLTAFERVAVDVF